MTGIDERVAADEPDQIETCHLCEQEIGIAQRYHQLEQAFRVMQSHAGDLAEENYRLRKLLVDVEARLTDVIGDRAA